ncbi:MAG TPA: zinc ribbon domain-containing protein [Pyrinomonadaceae bacterium]|nr:zinc ribbon domain-containing protein [Pyrinomonadaceae bacterium]
MYCPNCGQQQVSEEMRFCSRCGLALTGLADWLVHGRVPLMRRDEAQVEPTSPRRKSIRRAAKMMFFSAVLFPIFLVFSLAAEEPGPMAVPFILFFISLAWMLYARLFKETHARASLPSSQATVLGPTPTRNALPPPINVPIPGVGRNQVRTNELAQPPSVTENTTRFLDKE